MSPRSMTRISPCACRTDCLHTSCSYTLPTLRPQDCRQLRRRQLQPWPVASATSPSVLKTSTCLTSSFLGPGSKCLGVTAAAADCAPVYHVARSRLPPASGISGNAVSTTCRYNSIASWGTAGGGRVFAGGLPAPLHRRRHNLQCWWPLHSSNLSRRLHATYPAIATTTNTAAAAVKSPLCSVRRGDGQCKRTAVLPAAFAADITTSGTLMQSPARLRAQEGEKQRLLGLLTEQLNQRGVELPKDLEPGVWHKGLCPFCGGDSGREPFSFNLILSDDLHCAYYRCWRANKCGVEETVWAESVRIGLHWRRSPAASRPQLGEAEQQDLDEDALAYFASRGIRAETLRAAGVFQTCNAPHPLQPGALLERVVVYPYFKEGTLVNVTYHDIHGYCSRIPLTGSQDNINIPGDAEHAYSQDHPSPAGHAQQLRNRAQLDHSQEQGRYSRPGVRWQLLGAERVLWGLNQLAFTEDLQRHKQKLKEARKPPLARARGPSATRMPTTTLAAESAGGGAGNDVAVGASGEGGTVVGQQESTAGTVAAASSQPDVMMTRRRAGTEALQPAVTAVHAVDGEWADGGGERQAGPEAEGAAEPYLTVDDEVARRFASGKGYGFGVTEGKALEASSREDEHDYQYGEYGNDEEDKEEEEKEEDSEVVHAREYEDEEEEEEEGYGNDADHGGAYRSPAQDAAGGLRFKLHGSGAGEEAAAYAYPHGFMDMSLFGLSSRSLDADSDNRLSVVLVEDEVERLCMMEAGISNVLALPPRAVLDYQRHSEGKAKAQPRARTETRSRPSAAAVAAAAAATSSAASGPPVQQPVNDIMSYMVNSRPFLCPEPAVVGGQVQVTLALRETPESRMLAEELATGLSRERCRVLRWPAEAGELPPCSGAVRQQRTETTWPRHANSDDTANYDPGPDYLNENFAEQSSMQQTADGGPYKGAVAAAPVTPSPRPLCGDGGRGWGGIAGEASSAGLIAGAVARWNVLHQPPPPPLQSPKHQDRQQHQDRQPLRHCAMDVLLEDGREALRHLVDTARPYPVRGLVEVTGLWDELLQHWYGKEQTAAGVSTGWPGLDELYKVAPGELTVVTGVPNSGKSHWLDALAVQLASGAGWRIAFASFEKSVVRHAQNLIELAAQKPMFNKQGIPLLSPEEFRDALLWVNDYFVLIRHADMADEPAAAAAATAAAAARVRPPGRGTHAQDAASDGRVEGILGEQGDEEEVEVGGKEVEEEDDLAAQEREDARQPCTIDWVLAKATQAVYRYGIRGLVIDPYNELEQRRGAQTETEYVSAMLGKVKRWAQRYMVHVWLVAHPKSMEDWDGGPPTMYDISGSAHWYNKADMGLVVHRYTRVAVDAALRKRQAAAAAAAVGRPGGRGGKPLQIPWRENETLIKVLKARNKTSGTQGDYTLEYDKDQCKFRDPRVEPGRH